MSIYRNLRFLCMCCFFAAGFNFSFGQEIPKLLSDKKVKQANYLPDFSFAGYHNGEASIPTLVGKIVKATDHGVFADDGKDDTAALKKAILEASKIEGKVILQLPKGPLILSDILYIERSNFV